MGERGPAGQLGNEPAGGARGRSVLPRRVGWLAGKTAAQQQDAITALAQTPVHGVRPAVEAGLVGIDCDPATRAQLVTYLTAIPMTARRAITRRTTAGGRRRSSGSSRGAKPTSTVSAARAWLSAGRPRPGSRLPRGSAPRPGRLRRGLARAAHAARGRAPGGAQVLPGPDAARQPAGRDRGLGRDGPPRAPRGIRAAPRHRLQRRSPVSRLRVRRRRRPHRLARGLRRQASAGPQRDQGDER